MQSNIVKRMLFIAVLFGGVLFAVFVLYPPQTISVWDRSISFVEHVVTPSHNKPTNQEQAGVGSPARLKIPSIQVDTNVIPVGLTSDGAMDVPDGPDEVAWFDPGARPGEDDTAVMTGHYGWKNNIPAVFDNLHKLKVGDKIFAEDENGKTTTFVVRDTRVYDKDAIVPEVFRSSDGEGHLNLVTCTGDWNATEDTFSERLVVFADKE